MAVTSFSTVKAALGASFRNYSKRYFYTDETYLNGTAVPTEIDGTAAVVSDGGVNLLLVNGAPSPRYFAYFVEQGFAGAIPQVIQSRAAGGLTVVLDAATNDGLFFAPVWCTSAGQGALLTAGNGLFTVGTDAFFLRVKLNIATKASADEVAVGFRKVQAFDTSSITATDNTDFFALNVDNGTIKTLSNLNDAGVSSTSTTQTTTDGTSFTLEIRVSAAGVVKSYINGANPTVEVANFTFDNGDLLMPYLGIVTDASGDPSVKMLSWEHGLLEDRGLDSITDTTN